MIKKLHLKNFKSHRDTELNIKPLTLISGVNNVGKSSVLQSLLLLRQTFKRGKLGEGLVLNKPLIELGRGNDVLYKFAQDPILAIELTMENTLLSYRYRVDENALEGSLLPLIDSSISLLSASTDALFSRDFQYLSSLRLGGESDFTIDSDEAVTEKQISYEKGKGELIGNFLYAYQDEPTFDYINNSDDSIPLLDQVMYWEGLISSGVTINVQKKADKPGFTILYGTKGKEGKKSIEGLRAENIGFGVSYSLPVITALLSASPGALVMIENPEAHLHPDGQAELARLMCLAAQRGVQVIVETHSDHIINGVLVNCKRYEEEGYGISRDSVSIYYFSGQDEEHAVEYEEVKILPNGKVEYQPRGFFDRVEKDIDYLLED
jgi:predicted ATPase